MRPSPTITTNNQQLKSCFIKKYMNIQNQEQEKTCDLLEFKPTPNIEIAGMTTSFADILDLSHPVLQNFVTTSFANEKALAAVSGFL